jgi:hypothetical protein
MSSTTDVEQVRNEWLERLNDLMDTVEGWVKELDWVTRRIETTLKDSKLGKYKAPALVIQKETYRVLLEPITHAAPGADGVFDLYLMPGLDDIASLYRSGGTWKIHYMFSDSPTVASIREATAKPLNKDTLQEVLGEMIGVDQSMS